MLPDTDSDAKRKVSADALKAVHERNKAIAEKLPEWFATLAKQTAQKSTDLTLLANKLRRGEAGAQARVAVFREDAGIYRDRVNALLTLWANAKADIFTAFPNDQTKTETAVKALQSASGDLTAELTLTSGLQSARAAEFITQEARLSYFPDTARLMHILNPTTRLFDPTNGQAGTDFTDKRGQLRRKDADIRDKQGQISDIQTNRRRLDGLLRASQNEQRKRTDIYNRALGQQSGLIDSKTVLTEALKNAMDDTERKSVQNRLEGINAKIPLSDEAAKAALEDKTAADTRLADLSSESSGLAARESTLATQQATIETERNKLAGEIPGLADDVTQAFAFLRDNAPYLQADPIFDDPDPTRRVYLYGDPNSRTVTVRGEREAVRAVLDVIAQLDKPSPQTRLTFYALQVSGEDKYLSRKEGGEENRTVLEVVDEQTENIRIGTAGVSDSLRDSVSEIVNEYASGKLTSAGYRFKTPTEPVDRLRRYGFYGPVVRELSGLSPV